MMKLTLQVNGREMSFSEEKLTAILEEYFEGTYGEVKEKVFAKTPMVGKWFKVNPLTIDQSIFLEAREDYKQEVVRKLILEAFDEAKKNEKYQKPFSIYIPEKKWSGKKVKDFKRIANQTGDSITNWIEQALVWAQRIQNGETWQKLCNEKDDIYYYRLVIWKDDEMHIVGSSSKSMYPDSPTNISTREYGPEEIVDFAVPSITAYE
mgnify:CR=1 FL=1